MHFSSLSFSCNSYDKGNIQRVPTMTDFIRFQKKGIFSIPLRLNEPELLIFAFVVNFLQQLG